MVGFSGNPETEWLATPAPDRRMKVLKTFWFDDRQNVRWSAPPNSIIDGASIPRALWTLVGSPYTGQYRRASIVHDLAVVAAGDDDGRRRAADRMFFEACRAGGCSMEEATVLYAGVRIGSTWSGFAALTIEPEVRIVRSHTDRRLEADFQMVATTALSAGPSDDPLEVEQRVDAALAMVAGLPPQS